MKAMIRKTRKLLSYLLVLAMSVSVVTPLFGEKVLAASMTITEAAG